MERSANRPSHCDGEEMIKAGNKLVAVRADLSDV